MNRRERVSVSIPCFRIIISAVLYITNAPSIQMIQELLGNPVVYQFYDMRLFACEASFPPPPCYTTSFWYIIYYHNLHLSFEGSCVTRGGGTVSYKKKLKSLYILSNKCPDGHKNLDYWYLLCKYSPDP